MVGSRQMSSFSFSNLKSLVMQQLFGPFRQEDESSAWKEAVNGRDLSLRVGFWLVTDVFSRVTWPGDDKLQGLRYVLGLQLSCRASRPCISPLFGLGHLWVPLGRMSVSHVALMSQFIKSLLPPKWQKEIGNQAIPFWVTTSFLIMGSSTVRDGGVNLMIFFFTFSGTAPKKLTGNRESKQ